MNFMKLRTGPRLFLSFLLVLAVMGLIVWIAIGRLQAVNHMAEYLVNDKLAKQQVVADWLGEVRLNGISALSIAKSDSLELETYFMARLEEGDRHVAKLGQAVRGDSAEERALLAAIAQQQAMYWKLRQQVFQLKAVGKTLDVERLVVSSLEPALERYTVAIHRLLDYQKQQAGSITAESAARYRSSRMMLAGLGSLAIALGVLFAWLLTRSIVRPLKNAVNLAQKIADGKLNTEFTISRHDEIGQLLQALQAMNASLALTIHAIDQEANAITDAAGRMVERNDGLSHRTETQALTLEQTASAVEQVTAAVRQNAGHAQQARQLAVSATELAGLGSQDISEAIATMNLMKHGTGQIAEISSMIDGIAFQTNILALNATVEAARAGTHGRSFAVVAAEVRRLAQRSALAAKEINGLIDGLIEQIHRGDALTSAAGKTMHRIVDASRHVADIINDISVASHEQSVGIQQTNQAILEMEHVTQRNAVFVKESALTAQKLQRQALNLRQAVGFFTLAQGPAPQLPSTVPAIEGRVDMARYGGQRHPPLVRSHRPRAVLAKAP